MVKTKIFAHRGASGWDTKYAPENTMPAFEKAIENINLPNNPSLKIDPTFSQPGVTVTLSLIRSELEKIEETKKAIQKLFNEVPEL